MPELIRRGLGAFGKSLTDYLNGDEKAFSRVIRLEDGNVEKMYSSFYFNTYDDWSPTQKALTVWITGRVLDVGVGAGRLALFLQEKGLDVTAIDLDPAVLDVARLRGVKDLRLHDILAGPLDGEKFDTICLFGQNLGIAGKHENVGPFLDTLKSMLNPGGCIVGTQINWDRTDNPEHLKFQEFNRKAGRHPVEMTLRIAHEDIEEDFSWCLTDQEELRDIARNIGLDAETIIDSGTIYGYVLRFVEPDVN